MEFLHSIFGNDLKAAFLIIFQLVVIECLLSVDNAAVLATMVMDLPEAQREKALKYGIFGAYFFRGLCLLFASVLIEVWWLKPIGGIYLLYLVYDFLKGKSTTETTEDDVITKENKWFYKLVKNSIGTFWATVIAIEVMDLVFSIDNVFAAVGLSKNLSIVMAGVFIGILAMRFITQAFVKLMQRFPALEYSAFAVIAILGLKLLFSVVAHYYEGALVAKDFAQIANYHPIVSLVEGIDNTDAFHTPFLQSLTTNPAPAEYAPMIEKIKTASHDEKHSKELYLSLFNLGIFCFPFLIGLFIKPKEENNS